MPGSAAVLLAPHLIDTHHEKLSLSLHPPKGGDTHGCGLKLFPTIGAGFSDSQSALSGCATVAAPGPEGALETVAVGRGKCEPLQIPAPL